MEDSGSYKVCMRCGKLMPAGAAFCNSCGADLGAAASPGLQGAVGPQDFKSAMGLESAPAAVPPPATRPGPHPPSGRPARFAPGPYPAYGAAPAYGPYPSTYRQRRTDNMAVISLVCAVASFLILPLFPAVAAIATGFVARERIRESGGTLEGNGIALAGVLLGALNLLMMIGIFILVLLVYVST